MLVFNLEVVLETPPKKKTETSSKKFLKKTSFQVRDGLVKVQKQGRDEKTQEHYPTMEQWLSPLWPPMQWLSPLWPQGRRQELKLGGAKN